jgi:hypothetical protein
VSKAETISEETQELLDRAGRAIDRSVQLGGHTGRCLVEAQRKIFQLELAISERRAELLWAQEVVSIGLISVYS